MRPRRRDHGANAMIPPWMIEDLDRRRRERLRHERPRLGIDLPARPVVDPPPRRPRGEDDDATGQGRVGSRRVELPIHAPGGA
jgi:hypothetical protein